MYRIAILDNDVRALESLHKSVMYVGKDIKVVWMSRNGVEAISKCTSADGAAPDILIADMSLEGIQGPSVCERIRAKTKVTAILAVTSFSTGRYLGTIKRAGAQGIVSKDDDDALRYAVERIRAAGSMPGFETSMEAHYRIRCKSHYDALLSVREEEVINLIAEEGLLDKEVADKLGIAESTVRKHMQNIMRKLNARTARQAVAVWTGRNV